MFSLYGLGEIDARFRATGQRIALPFNLGAAVGEQRNPPARWNIGIDHVNAAGQRRSDQQFSGAENGAVPQTIFRAPEPLAEFGAELDSPRAIIVSRRFSGGTAPPLFCHYGRSR